MRKVALLGATGYDFAAEDLRVESIPWASVDATRNLKDYDVIILNLLTLDTKTIDWDNFRGGFNPNVTNEVLRTNGDIIVLGDPRFGIPTGITPALPGSPAREFRTSFLEWWTHLGYYWVSGKGDTKEFHDVSQEFQGFRRLITSLRTWDYSLASVANQDSFITAVFGIYADKDVSGHVIVDRFCTNRSGHALAFAIHGQLTRTIRRRTLDEVRETFMKSGRIIVIPKTALPEEDQILILLKDYFNVELGRPQPEWIETIAVPGQTEVDSEISRIHNEISDLSRLLRDAEELRTQLRKPLGLLYQGDAAFETTVRDTLRAMGVSVEDPVEANKEDGWISIDTEDAVLEGVLEIKSTRKQHFDEQGLRQLSEWMLRGQTLRSKTYKGLFVGNSMIDAPIEGRPIPFGANWQKSAAHFRIAALRSEDLFVAFCLQRLGLLDSRRFWTDLFRTDGLFDASAYRQLLYERQQRNAADRSR